MSEAKNYSVPSRRTVVRSLILGALIAPLAACSVEEDPLAKQAKDGAGKNYIAGDGAVEEYSLDERTDPVALTTSTYQGSEIDFADWSGAPIVLNFWYAACAPCRIEAPHLRELAEHFGSKVHFLGVNVRDEEAAATAFEREFKVPYESVNDIDGKIQLAMTKYVPLQAVPTTLVLDRKGRVRARVIGAIEKSTLKSLIDSALTEQL
ncbi:TlpA disulfide reductase family protein [Glutamicibacter sp. PS]|uniref:TlpA family protein disulfide reductase n=1 Tax=Glutamicibacter sp. PS TaxID=3075634 RepID=UPI00284E592C|nr:TlpA disulfide reductase family protein [Glutamicibacter sp. PS]MDR4532098.1 TlpA family protein disulfide reductase [Glutamicibacter sp. PS]